jgi:peptidoglycan-associated lipoprotein
VLSGIEQRRKKMRKKVWLVLTLVLVVPAMLFSVSCAKKEMASEPAVTEPAPQPEPAAMDNMDKGPSAEEMAATEAQQALVEAKSNFTNEDVYFEFDSASLLPSAQQILATKAELLNAHSDITATIGGHCDERGTDAYNMALGQRRADAAKAFLVNLGVGANQLTTISYGEEQPVDPGQNEAAWAKNRRAHFSID